MVSNGGSDSSQSLNRIARVSHSFLFIRNQLLIHNVIYYINQSFQFHFFASEVMACVVCVCSAVRCPLSTVRTRMSCGRNWQAICDDAKNWTAADGKCPLFWNLNNVRQIVSAPNTSNFDTRCIAQTARFTQHRIVLLQIVPFARNKGHQFLAGRQSNEDAFSVARIRFPRLFDERSQNDPFGLRFSIH